jgi:hypothetical protein
MLGSSEREGKKLARWWLMQSNWGFRASGIARSILGAASAD